MNRVPSPLAGLLAVHGALGRKTQEMISKMCTRGKANEVLRPLAEYLCEEEMRLGHLPPNVGIREKEMQEITRSHALFVAERYKAAGGYLLARGHRLPTDLAYHIVDHWERTFRPPIPVSLKLGEKMTQEELSDRVCVASLCAKAKFEELAEQGLVLESTGGSYYFDKEHLEAILGPLIKVILWAFDDPNAAQQQFVKARKPSGSDPTPPASAPEPAEG